MQEKKRKMYEVVNSKLIESEERRKKVKCMEALKSFQSFVTGLRLANLRTSNSCRNDAPKESRERRAESEEKLTKSLIHQLTNFLIKQTPLHMQQGLASSLILLQRRR